jgi:hypothetical protein
VYCILDVQGRGRRTEIFYLLSRYWSSRPKVKWNQLSPPSLVAAKPYLLGREPVGVDGDEHGGWQPLNQKKIYWTLLKAVRKGVK